MTARPSGRLQQNSPNFSCAGARNDSDKDLSGVISATYESNLRKDLIIEGPRTPLL